MSLRVFLLGVLSFTVTLPAQSSAQELGCTYDRCALRLQSRLFSERVVKGSTATVVGRLGLFAPRIEALAAAGDSAASHYESFRRYQNRGGVLTLVAAASTVTAGIVVASSARDFEDPPSATWVLLGVGFTFALAGDINVKTGRDHLHQAIWFYNRSLP